MQSLDWRSQHFLPPTKERIIYIPVSVEICPQVVATWLCPELEVKTGDCGETGWFAPCSAQADRTITRTVSPGSGCGDLVTLVYSIATVYWLFLHEGSIHWFAGQPLTACRVVLRISGPVGSGPRWLKIQLAALHVVDSRTSEASPSLSAETYANFQKHLVNF
jgi:hypothetical protein